MSNERLTGKIVFFAPAKQFGFIKPDGNERDIFFHLESYDGDEPEIGDKVTFLAEADPRHQDRLRAKVVVPIR